MYPLLLATKGRRQKNVKKRSWQYLREPRWPLFERVGVAGPNLDTGGLPLRIKIKTLTVV